MKKSFNTIVMYKNKFKPNIIPLIFWIIGIAAIINDISIYRKYSSDMNIRVIICLFGYVIIALIFWVIGFYFYKRSRIYQKNAIDIKRNGKILYGKVAHIIREEDYNTTTETFDEYTYFIVKFKEDNQNEKFIVTRNLPEVFNNISVVTNPQSSYNNSNVEIKEYFGEGYITFDEEKARQIEKIFKIMPSMKFNGKNINEGKKRYTYIGDVSKNYEGEIKCNVYEKDGKYVIDDFDGVEYEEKKSILDIIILIVFFALCALIIYFQVLKK